MNKKILVTIAAVALLGLVPNAIGDGAGLSGQCYNSDASQGGQDEARVSTDGNVVLLPGTTGDSDPADGKGGAVDALALFATEAAKDGGNTGNACKRYDCGADYGECEPGRNARADYLEVDASFGAVFVQACYDSGVRTNGVCPTSPTGEGS